jgi:hypothetical protein
LLYFLPRKVKSFYVAQGNGMPIEIDLKIKSIRKQLRTKDLSKSKGMKKIKSEEKLITFFENLEQ